MNPTRLIVMLWMATGWPAWGRLSLPTPPQLRAAPGGPMRLIDISTRKYPNKFAMVDDADFDWLNQWKWRASGRGYSYRSEKTPLGKRNVPMHRQILNTPKGLLTDHIDCNKLNNQRGNLRVATQLQNNHNVERFKTNTSGFIGVSWDRRKRKWRSAYTQNNRCLFIGYFDSLEQAARARDRVVERVRGRFAKLNFPLPAPADSSPGGQP